MFSSPLKRTHAGAKAAGAHPRTRRVVVSCLAAGALLSPPGSAVKAQPTLPLKVKVSAEQSVPDMREADQGQVSPREEMLKNVEVKRRELSYQENLEKAKEGAQLGAEICAVFERNGGLDSAAIKKLGRMEKLARSIRGEAGGDEDETELKDPPANLAAAFKRLAEVSDCLRKLVEKTPKHVVSAAVIAEANQLIELLRHIKSFGIA